MLFPFLGFLTLLLFKLLLQARGLLEFLVLYCGRDGLPETLGFIGELGGEWGCDLGRGPERAEVD